jgi:hypothetical protein
MAKDRFDIFHLLVVLLTVVGIAALFLGGAGRGQANTSLDLDRQLEQELAYRAKVSFLQDIYAPVEVLTASGQEQQALLQLEEIGRRYPGEGYGFILKGRILKRLNTSDEAIASYVRGVKLNGDFVDRHSPLSVADEIELLVDEGLAEFKPKASAHPDNPTLKLALTNLYYLQSRLAGGCE